MRADLTEPEEPLLLEREIDVLRQALSLVRARMPNGWATEVREQVRIEGIEIDALVSLRAPDATEAVLVVEAKRLISTSDVPAVVEQLNRAISRLRDILPPSTDDRRTTTVVPSGASYVPFVVGRYLPQSTRDRLDEAGASYADATGNIRLVLNKPPIFLRDVGAQKDPWRGPGRPRGTLQGPPAARVVRALVDFYPPMTVPELIALSGASSGATYRAVEFLQEEALIERARGQIIAVDWPRLLRRWSEDYGFLRSNTVLNCLEPRGVEAVLRKLSGSRELLYAVTGSIAAGRIGAPYAPPRLAMLYVDDPSQAMSELGMRAVDSGANVLIAATNYGVVFERNSTSEGIRIAEPSQVVVDLMTGPGRSSSEAVELLSWMQTNEAVWRRPRSAWPPLC